MPVISPAALVCTVPPPTSAPAGAADDAPAGASESDRVCGPVRCGLDEPLLGAPALNAGLDSELDDAIAITVGEVGPAEGCPPPAGAAFAVVSVGLRDALPAAAEAPCGVTVGVSGAAGADSDAAAARAAGLDG